jgi:hypothetical protein
VKCEGVDRVESIDGARDLGESYDLALPVAERCATETGGDDLAVVGNDDGRWLVDEILESVATACEVLASSRVDDPALVLEVSALRGRRDVDVDADGENVGEGGRRRRRRRVSALLHDARPLLPLNRGSSRRFLRASRPPAPDSTPVSWNSSEDYPDHPCSKAGKGAVKNRSPTSHYPRAPLTQLLQM